MGVLVVMAVVPSEEKGWDERKLRLYNACKGNTKAIRRLTPAWAKKPPNQVRPFVFKPNQPPKYPNLLTPKLAIVYAERQCRGGPFDGQMMSLDVETSRQTLPIKLGEWYGYYDNYVWVSLKPYA